MRRWIPVPLITADLFRRVVLSPDMQPRGRGFDSRSVTFPPSGFDMTLTPILTQLGSYARFEGGVGETVQHSNLERDHYFEAKGTGPGRRASRFLASSSEQMEAARGESCEGGKRGGRSAHHNQLKEILQFGLGLRVNPIYLPTYLSIYLPIYLSTYLFIYMRLTRASKRGWGGQYGTVT